MTRMPYTTDPKLLYLHTRLKKYKMTPREQWDQRVSFVYGQLPVENTLTKEDIERIVTEMVGPRP